MSDLEAENKRLREALKNIMLWCEADPVDAVLRAINDSARTALKEGT